MSEKPVAFVASPSYGQLTAGAARGLFRPTEGGLDVQINAAVGSLLAANMNELWCWGLNHVHRGGRLDYWAMIHSDIEPNDWWLDVLVKELDDRGLDVLGAVTPIKDIRGVTSIALARDDGDPWRVHSRLTMKEVYKLPETFTAADIPGGRPLLINTGLWVCRWNQEWARQFHFTINDRIVFNSEKGFYFHQVESEDWFISRAFHELGLKVGVTRKVTLGHQGPMTFVNSQPWGAQEFDEGHLDRSVLATGPSDPFPIDVAGWLTDEEGAELARLAAGKTVLEVGSFCGRSTICLARAARAVTAVDTFDGRGTVAEGDTYPTFQRNLRQYAVTDKVVACRGPSADILPKLPPVYDLAFIDGSHDASSVRQDAELAAACLKPGGVLVFHDYVSPSDPGVREAVEELVAAGGTVLGRCGSMAVVRPPAGAPLEV